MNKRNDMFRQVLKHNPIVGLSASSGVDTLENVFEILLEALLEL